MDDRAFWKLVDEIDRDALREGDDHVAVEPLRRALAKLPPEEIEAFEEELAHKLFALDGRRYAAESGSSAGSADGFLYARCHVVARGRELYERVLGDPSAMPKSADEQCEALLSVAPDAYEAATGRAWTFEATVSYESGSNDAAW